MVDGTHEDYWSPTFNGDTLHITLETDHSVDGYGFRADLVEYYHQQPAGRCNRDDDCPAGQACAIPRCVNPYAPCHGTCQAVEGGCATDADCTRGFCKGIVNGRDACQDALWCDAATVAADCASVLHPAVPGVWTCPDHRCTWESGLTGGRFESIQKHDIPDADPRGISSPLPVNGLLDCPVDASVELRVDHTDIGDLRVRVIDPAGNEAVVHDRAGGSSDGLGLTDVALPALGAEGGNGNWILAVSDHAYWDTGTLVTWSLTLTCRSGVSAGRRLRPG